jgi:hypothetical protein
MKILVEPLDSKELPAYEVTVKVTQCENRFEIVAKPGVMLDYAQLKSLLTNWVVARIDAQKARGHNRSSSERG